MLCRISSSLSYRAHPLGGATATGAAAEPAPTLSRLTITNRTVAGRTTLILCGDIDLASAPALEWELHRAEGALPGCIVLDLAALDFIDSAGIHLLIDAQRRADASGQRLVLTHVPPHAQRLFSLAGIDGLVTIA